MNTIKAINDDKDKLKTLWNRIYELEAERQEISALFPDDATHKHEQTGESLYDNIQDALRNLERAKADLAAAREDVVRMRKQIADHEEAEASVCPEDVGFVEFIGVLQKRIAGLEEQLKYAKAPVDKGIPMHVYRAVCEQRDYELGERQRMTHRYEVEALRNKVLEEQLTTAKAEGAAEAYEAEAQGWAEQAVRARSTYVDPEMGRMAERRAVEARDRAAAIRNGLEAKEGK